MVDPAPTGNINGSLGIIAGRGVLPLRLIEACRDQGRDFLVIAIKGQTPPETVNGVPHLWMRLGSAASVLPPLRDAGVRDLVMAGAITRPSFLTLLPNWRSLMFLLKTGALALGDDGLLGAVVRQLEKDGFRVVGVNDVLPSLLADKGVYGTRTPDPQSMNDIAVGIRAAKALGARDVGQGVVVRAGMVIDEEDAKGTDAMLARTPVGSGGVLVKVAKPEQETRADLPTIGVATIEGAVRAGLAGIAIEAGASLVVDKDAVIAAADRAGVFVVGVEAAP